MVTFVNEKTLQTNQRKPSISLCMIVKNEEACLDRCLKSVHEFVDEIIVVDTGSTDRTVEIAAAYGAKICHHPWENDFSKHRNQSLSYATGDWILQLDADEELFAGDGQKLRQTIAEGGADYYNCQFHDMNKDGSVHGVFYLRRLFRNGMGMHFTQKVHNQLQTRGVEAYSSIRIRHYGYGLSEDKMEAKHIRTTTLLKEILRDNPEDAYGHFQLASSYSMHREYGKAVEHGETALALRRRGGLRNGYFVTAFYTVAQGYYALGNSEDAERVGLEALEFYAEHLDICHLLAALYFKRQSLDRCRAMSHRYLSIYDEFVKDPSVIGSFYCHSFAKRNEVFFGLACIHFFEKDFEQADAYFLKAFEDAGRQMDKAENIGRFYLEQHMAEMALQWLVRAYEAGLPAGNLPGILTERPALFLKVGSVYLQKGDPKAARMCLENADEQGLAPNERFEKRLMLTTIAWRDDRIEDLLTDLEGLMLSLGMSTDRSVESLAHLGQIVYDIAETFCGQKQWAQAETALQLAVQIHPAGFDHDKFHRLLLNA